MSDGPTRTICSADLIYRLSHCQRVGVAVPVLKVSECSPVYTGTTQSGDELYAHAGRILHVEPGNVIDPHGNVVSLKNLEWAYMIRLHRGL
jgi:hypothetical protein